MVVCLQLVNIALDNSLSTPHDFDLNLDLGDVDGHPPPILPLSNAQHYAQMLSYFIMDNSTNFDIHVVIEHEKLLETVRKMIGANCSRQQQRTLDTIFVPI